MTRHYVSERRKRHRELAARELQLRCRQCKRDLKFAHPVLVSLDGTIKWCSADCRDTWLGVDV